MRIGDAPAPTGSKGTPGVRSPPPRPSTRGWSRRERSAEGERPADLQTARIGPHPGQCFGTPLCRRKITVRASARLLFAIAFIGGMDNAALAGSRASLADLLGQGYEVKATSTLSLTDSKALNEANITPTVLVTLQKGPSIAVCTFGAPFWELIGTAKDDPLHTPERCDVT